MNKTNPSVTFAVVSSFASSSCKIVDLVQLNTTMSQSNEGSCLGEVGVQSATVLGVSYRSD